MNSQELLNLQEAYLDVYLLDEANRGDEHVTASMYMSKEPYTTSAKIYRRQGRDFNRVLHPDDWGTQGEPVRQQRHTERRGVKTRGSGVRETVDLYDFILSHLLDEGYAEYVEQAEAIMVNMSEEWRESIVEKFSMAADTSKPQSPKRTKLPPSRETKIGPHDDWQDTPTKWGELPPAAKKLRSRAITVTGTRRREDIETGVR